jgi:hypothetical protein
LDRLLSGKTGFFQVGSILPGRTGWVLLDRTSSSHEMQASLRQENSFRLGQDRLLPGRIDSSRKVRFLSVRLGPFRQDRSHSGMIVPFRGQVLLV